MVMSPLIRTVAATASTNDDVAALARAGEPEGLWLRAETQSGGKGRQGRNWVSPPGNLYASTLVRLIPGDPPAPTLALVAAVALDQLLTCYVGKDRVSIKWPNDLLLDGAKVAGILLERVEDAVVVGFGLNIAACPEGLDRPATSLADAGGGAHDPGHILLELTETFKVWRGRWRNEGLAPVRRQWLQRAHPAGAALAAHSPDGSVVEGLFDGLDESGALRLRLADGTLHVIHAGDVFLL